MNFMLIVFRLGAERLPPPSPEFHPSYTETQGDLCDAFYYLTKETHHYLFQNYLPVHRPYQAKDAATR